ncbi:porin family protein [bacterium]|nr:porin family protein [bacterium]
MVEPRSRLTTDSPRDERARWAAIAAAVVILLLVLAAWSGAALAAPVGGLSYNLTSPPAFSIGTGVGFALRDVVVENDENLVDEAQSSRFQVKIDVAPVNYIDVYALIGAADLQLDDGDFRGTLATLYGGGLRFNIFPLWFYDTNLRISLDGQYLGYTTSDEVGGTDIEARYQETQAALIVAYIWQGVVPYGGLKYDPVAIGVTGRDNDLAGDQQFGVLIGADYFITPHVFFNGELSIFTETSIFLSVGYKFPAEM